jgi:diaminopimelate decarboxylase
VSIYCDNTKELIRKIVESENLNLKGYHIHIGSQILLESSYYASIKVIVDFINKIKEEFGYEAEELNLGGGFGVYYSEEDTPFPLGDFLKTLTNKIHIEMVQKGLSINKVMIEPGRSIVANSGTTLYKVGNMKDTYGGKKYIFVDGGMTDNPRKALYDSKYEACIANRLFDNNEDVYTIAGKCCESGDILIKDINITVPKKGDVLAVFGTGAYNYSMASNYNRILKPGVVFLEDGKAIEVVKRESYRDLLRNDI